MKVLIVYCHPNPASFNHAVKEVTERTLKELGHDLKVRDLYAVSFDPVLSGTDLQQIRAGTVPEAITREQEDISWAEDIIFIHPVWWTGLPALLKGYIDRVLSFGFAYTYEDGLPRGLLHGKRALIINTTGAPSEYYQQVGMHEALKSTSDTGIYAFCGFEVIDHLFFGAVPSVSDDVRKQYLKDVSQALAGHYGNA